MSPTKMKQCAEGAESANAQKEDLGKNCNWVLCTGWKNDKLISAAAKDEHALLICNLPDPEGIYAAMATKADFSKSYMDIPDGNGVLMTPAEYEQKLETGMIVLVTTYLKPYASSICADLECWLMFCCSVVLKSVGAWKKTPVSGVILKPVMVNQLMLNEMQILPTADESKIALLENKVVDLGNTQGE
jgi:hypothetical protein